MLELAGVLRRSLNRAVDLVDLLAPEWPATPGSPADQELVASGEGGFPSAPSPLHVLQGQLSTVLLACVGLVESTACALEGNSLAAGPSTLARQAVEHAAVIAWLLDPALSFRQRVARVALLEDEGLEHDMRARDVAPSERAQVTEIWINTVQRWFVKERPGTVELHSPPPPMRGPDGIPIRDTTGTVVAQPRLLRVAGENAASISARVTGLYGLLGASTPYAWMSSRTHPTTPVLRRGRLVDADGRATPVIDARELDRLVFLAAHALAVAATTIVRWHGFEVDAALMEWEDDLDAVVPGHFSTSPERGA